ncbi:MAG: pyrimidine-nucleoside phosphorylase, partial [Endomicrobiia bacterium]|nr:pyrimidine-nucleoside phosphorylase [Endomicrobiia bacterium]
SQPLGKAVGNSLEIEQTVAVLKGGGPDDFRLLVVELAARMIMMAGKYDALDTARADARKNLDSGAALEKFAQMVEAQGGDADVAEHPEKVLPRSKFAEDIKIQDGGFISEIKTDDVGICSLELGAGRAAKEDKIDHAAGIILHKKIGDKITPDEALATFFYNKARAPLEQIKKKFLECFKLSETQHQKPVMLHDEIK